MLGVIGTYQATDQDSGKPAENVQYAKGKDPDNWLSVNSETAEIRLNKVPDRESPFLFNGTYYATILCLSQGVPVKTATGTIAIQVEDTNDNCPTLTSNLEYICSNTQVVIVTATDTDAEPNGAPFLFTLVPEKTTGKWGLELHSDTSAALTPNETLWPGRYTVGLMILDQQGMSCPTTQLLDLIVCSCVEGQICGAEGEQGAAFRDVRASHKFGPSGIAALFLGVLILLFVGLIPITCLCGVPGGTFTELPYDTRENLIAYHTEGQGEDKGVPPFSSPYLIKPARPLVYMANHTSNMSLNMTSAVMAKNMTSVYKLSSLGNLRKHRENKETPGLDMTSHTKEDARSRYDGIALSNTYLYDYYSQKARHPADSHLANDVLLVYEYEGKGSTVGSVGCCSLLEFDHDLGFLDDLDLKFKTLAEVCSPKPLSPPNLHQTVPVQLKVEQVARPSAKEPKPIHINHGGITDSNSTNVRQSSTVNPGLFNTSSTVNPGLFNTSSIVNPGLFNTSSIVNPGLFNTSSIVNPGYFNTSSTGISASSTTAQPGLHCPLATVAMLPAAYQPVLVQEQPIFYTTASIPMACIIQPQLQCTALLEEGPAEGILSNVGLLNRSPEHIEYVSGGGESAGVFAFPRAAAREGHKVRSRSQEQGDIRLVADVDHGFQCMAMTTLPAAHIMGAVAQEVREVVWQPEGFWFDPRALPN